jgi:hypothetical protein
MNPHSDNELSNLEIEKYLKNYKRFGGCFSKDQLPTLKDNYYYIINLQHSKDGGGSHWTCLYCFNPHHALYMDPMGYPPPEEIENKIDFVIWDDKPIQDIDSTACGYYCICFIKVSYYMENKNKALKFFNDLFTNNTKKNDYILEKLLKSS